MSDYDDIDYDEDYDDACRMTRSTDPETSLEAAAIVLPHVQELHRKLVRAFGGHGKMSHEQIDKLEPFKDGFAPSTVRSRCAELVSAGIVRRVGITKNERGHKVIVWDLV